MRPSPEVIAWDSMLSVSEAGYEINAAMQDLQDSRDRLKACQEALDATLLACVMDVGMTRADLSRITGYSRRQIGRMLRQASAWV
jgi:uncharacterized membrane protein